MDFASSQRAVEDRGIWSEVVAQIFAAAPTTFFGYGIGSGDQDQMSFKDKVQINDQEDTRQLLFLF